jgi:hypothetical protein
MTVLAGCPFRPERGLLSLSVVRTPRRKPRSDLRKHGPMHLWKAGGGYEIRTREGLPPTRFPIPRIAVQQAVWTSARPGADVAWLSVNGRERRRMRRKLRRRSGVLQGFAGPHLFTLMDVIAANGNSSMVSDRRVRCPNDRDTRGVRAEHCPA